MGIKRCPNCGSTKLLARKITGVQVESLDNGEFQINAEGSKYQLEIIGCARCKEEFDESKLVEMVQCKKCGKFTNPENLNANGECDVCHALEERPDLANMSKEDLIRMMLKLEKTTSNTQVQSTAQTAPASQTAQEKMKAAQAAINNVSDDFSKEIIEDAEKDLKETQERVEELQNAMNPPEEPNDTEQKTEKPKRKRSPRKKSEPQEEQVQNNVNEPTNEQVENAANEMADSQEAPFPEQDNEMKKMFDEAAAQEQNVQQEQQSQSQSPFQMFDNEQSF